MTNDERGERGQKGWKGWKVRGRDSHACRLLPATVAEASKDAAEIHHLRRRATKLLEEWTRIEEGQGKILLHIIDENSLSLPEMRVWVELAEVLYKVDVDEM